MADVYPKHMKLYTVFVKLDGSFALCMLANMHLSSFQPGVHGRLHIYKWCKFIYLIWWPNLPFTNCMFLFHHPLLSTTTSCSQMDYQQQWSTQSTKIWTVKILQWISSSLVTQGCLPSRSVLSLASPLACVSLCLFTTSQPVSALNPTRLNKCHSLMTDCVTVYIQYY